MKSLIFLAAKQLFLFGLILFVSIAVNEGLLRDMTSNEKHNAITKSNNPKLKVRIYSKAKTSIINTHKHDRIQSDKGLEIQKKQKKKEANTEERTIPFGVEEIEIDSTQYGQVLMDTKLEIDSSQYNNP